MARIRYLVLVICIELLAEARSTLNTMPGRILSVALFLCLGALAGLMQPYSSDFSEPIDYCRQNEIAFRQPVDFVRPDCNIAFAPAETNIRMMALLFRQFADTINKVQRFAKILKCVS